MPGYGRIGSAARHGTQRDPESGEARPGGGRQTAAGGEDERLQAPGAAGGAAEPQDGLGEEAVGVDPLGRHGAQPGAQDPIGARAMAIAVNWY